MKELKYSVLMNKSSNQFSERGFECILAVVLVLGTIGLSVFIPVAGIAVAFIIAPFLCVGIKKYLLSIARGEFLPIEAIYGSYKFTIRAFCLKVAYTLICALWGIIFIIPGIISALNYSMASFVMADEENVSALEAMVKSKKMVEGYRLNIFIIYLSYFFISVVALCGFSAIGAMLRTFTIIPVWTIVVCMIVAFLFILVIFIIPYFELEFANVYLELKNIQIKEKKTVAKSSSGTKSTTKRRTTKTSVKRQEE